MRQVLDMMMDYGIRGRVAVVTGGDSGIGLETAKILVGGDARVILTDKGLS